MTSKYIKHLFTTILILTSVVCFAQEPKSVKKRQKILDKQEEAKQKAHEEAMEEGRKRHMNIQTKKTKKRMKKNAKKSKGLNSKKKKFFIFRWFS